MAPTKVQDRRRGRTAGLLAASLGLGVSEVVAGLVPNGRSPLVSVVDRIVDAAPGWLSRATIDAIGTADKPLVIVLTFAVVLAVGALAGVLRTTRPRTTAALVALVAALGALALLGDDEAGGSAFLAPVLGGLATWPTLSMLSAFGDRKPYGPLHADELGRRTFLAAGVITGSVAAAGGAAGRALQRGGGATASRAAVRLPAAARPLPPIPAGVELGLQGLAPWQTPNRDFYRIDTALLVPQVRAETWSLRIHGRVDRELQFTYEELLARPLVEADVTLACVSNGVGGPLVGNARWLGVPLAELLEEAGVRPDGDQVVGRSVDGFTAGFPTRLAVDGREALVAVGMNGEPLPIRHGFPARLVVPGIYGYVSATKWLESIELAGFDSYDGYWIDRGWAKEGPIKAMSRIDRPRYGSTVDRGTYTVAGVAWAHGPGVERVEVRVGEGAWEDATLAAASGEDTWRQWRWDWDAKPGRHVLQVRATEVGGKLQTKETQGSFPDGATGWHQGFVTVRR